MAITRSWEPTELLQDVHRAERTPSERVREWPFLLAATLAVACGLGLVFWAKLAQQTDVPQRLASGELLDLNAGPSAGKIAPFLQTFSDPEARDAAAARIADYVRDHGPLPNDGALVRLRGDDHKALIPLARLKPLLIVRTPDEFRREFFFWAGSYLASFWLVHFAWRWRRFRGDPAILPALQLLSGMGLMLAVSLRDPLRDSLEFKKFAWGCSVGCLLMLLPLFRFFQYRHFARWVYTPLLASFALFALLVLAGSGPTGSDSKVNLGPFQPVELIKILIVVFMAGYFARRWEWLRELQQRFIPGVPLKHGRRWPEIPRLAHILPVALGVSVALAFFFLLKDMGPALVIGMLFLSMFGVARGRFGLPLFGIFILVAGVYIGYRMGSPHTVVDRIDMWLSPWDNNVHGGDQVAHGLWGLATGGPWGSGPGMGDPALIPAGYTDLVLPSIGEEWGLAGVIAIFALLGLLVARAFRIARRAPDEYAMFLALGLGALIALEMLLISGGALDAIPLSGVVSPFLSFGNTAMLTNFLIFAILAGISHHARPEHESRSVFRLPVRVLGYALAAAGLALVARASYFQVFHDREYLIHDVKVIDQDRVKRSELNPRLSSLMRQIPRGDVYDRNGVLLATSNWTTLEKHRGQYAPFGVDIDQTCSKLEKRHYPFGTLLSHFLGDYRTAENFQAPNASLLEHDSAIRLQGYSGLNDLAEAVRYRHYPNDPHMRVLLDRNRDVKASMDVRLEERVAGIVSRHIGAAGTKGAVVVMNAATGDVLAMVSAPAPVSTHAPTPDELLDRARYGQYPPGSTFKLVTAMAALDRDPNAMRRTFGCVRLPDGRAGVNIRGFNRPIRDDFHDHPHGTLNMFQAITVSCNAYFAQLGVFAVGSDQLRAMAERLGISPGDAKIFKQVLPMVSYGQGPVVISPMKMARVAATIADDGGMPQGRWVIDESNSRADMPAVGVQPAAAQFIGSAMRNVVVNGTGRSALSGLDVEVAGKTGTAQLGAGDPDSWFAGFAPYNGARESRIAFAVLVEHGGYGAKAAAPIAREVVEAARDLGMIAGAPVQTSKVEHAHF